MKSIKVVLVLSILGLSAVACGDDSDSNSGTGNAELVATCKSHCSKASTANCLEEASLEECNTECDENGNAPMSDSCKAASKSYLDCISALSDICVRDACEAKGLAIITACAQ